MLIPIDYKNVILIAKQIYYLISKLVCINYFIINESWSDWYFQQFSDNRINRNWKIKCGFL